MSNARSVRQERILLTSNIGNVDIGYSVRSRDTGAADARNTMSNRPSRVQILTYKAPNKKIPLNDTFDFLDICSVQTIESGNAKIQKSRITLITEVAIR